MTKINKIILKNLHDSNFMVTDLAQEYGMSELKLNKILKSKLGLNVITIILEIRMLKAYEYIVQKKYPSQKEVIFAVGLTSRAYFNKRFYLLFGIKPSELKKKHSL